MKRSVVDDVVQPLTQTLGSDKTRISLALSIAVSFSLPLPNTRLSGAATPELYYIQHHMDCVNRFISEFNERFLIDVVEIAGAVKVIYATRYDMLYTRDPAKLMAIAKGTCPIRDFLASFSMDEETSSLVISAGIGTMERIERILTDESMASSGV